MVVVGGGGVDREFAMIVKVLKYSVFLPIKSF